MSRDFSQISPESLSTIIMDLVSWENPGIVWMSNGIRSSVGLSESITIHPISCHVNSSSPREKSIGDRGNRMDFLWGICYLNDKVFKISQLGLFKMFSTLRIFNIMDLFLWHHWSDATFFPFSKFNWCRWVYNQRVLENWGCFRATTRCLIL